jgi:type I restriction enzyme S subunit
MNRGAANPLITQGDLGRLAIAHPPLPEQRAIAHILGTLDDKIELNRRMSETLEAMARALFKSWFVDFEPVRAKMVGRWQRGQSLPGLPAHLYDLFPNRLVDSELGEIPEGWEVWCVRDIGNVVCGKTPSTKIPEYYGDDVPFITIPDMHGNIFVISTQKKLSHVGASSQARKTLPAGSICVSCIATPGLVVITTEESQTNQQINSVIPNQPGETYYWFWVLRDLGNEIKAGGSGGSVLTNLSTGRFSELRILACNRELRRAYHSHVVSIFEKILTNLRETKALAALRDALLPKLIRGEIRVKDAKRFLEERGI